MSQILTVKVPSDSQRYDGDSMRRAAYARAPASASFSWKGRIMTRFRSWYTFRQKKRPLFCRFRRR